MLNIALIGCGRIGRMHADLIDRHPQSRLTAVYDPVPAAAKAIAESIQTQVAATPEVIFNNDNVDAIVVASVTSTHADFIEQAVEAGKPVLCEKPIDLDIDRVRACRNKIAGSNVPVQIGFNRRFDPGHAQMKSAISAGDIGNLVQVLITSRDPEPPSDEYLTGAGGMLRDMTIHDFDLARFLLDDDEPVEVFAYAAPLIDPARGARLNEVDCAMIVMKSSNGRQVFINNARQAPYGYDQRLEAHGDGGMVQSTNRTPHGMQTFTAAGTGTAAPLEPFFIERYTHAFKHQLDSFVSAVLNKTQPEVGFDDGMRALLLAEAAYVSLEKGCAVKVAPVED
ncbi:inositol 2-dehydrogenase [Shimia sp.]|uniref:inositol 2-dehydrogenase n=1 Tax=Shimia sp. TaxID=1954381 RepID=UPI003298F6D8